MTAVDSKKKKTIEETYQKLSQKEHILKRPGMYIGDVKKQPHHTWYFDKEMKKNTIEYSDGFVKIFDEILTNALDHSMRDKTLTRIKVSYDEKTCKNKNYQMLPQQVIDKIFLNLDIIQLRKSRDIQSNYVKSCTRYQSTHAAAKNGKLKNISWLLKKGIQWHPDTLLYAVKKGTVNTVRFLLENNVPFPDDLIGLSYRCIRKNCLDVILYIKNKIPNFYNQYFQINPLMLHCVDYNRLLILKEIYSDICGTVSVAQRAIDSSNKQILQFLIDKKPILIQECINYAIKSHNLDIVSYLLSYKPNDVYTLSEYV